MMETKYDSYGNLIGKVLDDIKSGDRVEYIDTKNYFVGKKKINEKISLRGIWDGEKVVFDDKEKTTVRSIHWLKLIKNCPCCGGEI